MHRRRGGRNPLPGALLSQLHLLCQHHRGKNRPPSPTTAEEGYRYASREKIEPLITERTRAILITNPGNPTGAVLTREEQRLLVDICKEHGIFLVSDEVYREIIYSGEPLSSLLKFEDAAENIIVTDSISKRFSSCGARVGALISRNKHFMELAMKSARAASAPPLWTSLAPPPCTAA